MRGQYLEDLDQWECSTLEVAQELSHLADWSVWLGITDDSHYSVWKLWDLFYYFHKWEKQDPQDESYDVEGEGRPECYIGSDSSTPMPEIRSEELLTPATL